MSDSLNFAKLFSNSEETKAHDKGLTAGTHVLAINQVGVKSSREQGKFGRVQMALLSSTDPSLTKGMPFGEVYFIEIGKNKKTHQGRLRQMVRAIAKLPESATPLEVENAFVILIDEAKQPGRGMLVRCTGTDAVSETTGKPYVRTTYEAVEQTPANIKEMRDWVDTLNGIAAAQDNAATLPQPPVQTSFLAGLGINK